MLGGNLGSLLYGDVSVMNSIFDITMKVKQDLYTIPHSPLVFWFRLYFNYFINPSLNVCASSYCCVTGVFNFDN